MHIPDTLKELFVALSFGVNDCREKKSNSIKMNTIELIKLKKLIENI